MKKTFILSLTLHQREGKGDRNTKKLAKEDVVDVWNILVQNK